MQLDVERWAFHVGPLPTVLRNPPAKTRFRRRVLDWHRSHGRHHLPWRHTRDPYAILVSEVMLQQTQVATVIPFYNRWLQRFPGFPALAAAAENDVLHAWQGLGYYSRARNLHRAARTVHERFGGSFPRAVQTLREIPGIGRYTANAIATFAFDQSVPIVEANTARLLARLFDIRDPIDSSTGRDALWSRAASLVPGKNAGRFNSALMDLGALVCTARQPKCGVCPAKSFCRTRDPELLPVKRPRPKIRALVERHALVVRQNKVLLERCETRWRGMWMLPAMSGNGLKQSPTKPQLLHRSTFPFTHHRVSLQVYGAQIGHIVRPKQRWFTQLQLAHIPMPSPHRRALNAVLH